MDPVSRRKFLATSSAGALGVAGAAAIGPMASAAAADDEPTPDQLAHTGPALLQVHDAAKGEVELLIDERSIVFTDKRLVARMLRASK
jgi:hypothetical protein